MAISEIGEEFALSVGLETDRPAPLRGIVYLAEDTKKTWVCYAEADGWQVMSPFTVNDKRQLLYEGKLIFPEFELSPDYIENGSSVLNSNRYTFRAAIFPKTRPFYLAAKVTTIVEGVDWYVNGKKIYTSRRTGQNLHSFPMMRFNKPITSFYCEKRTDIGGYFAFSTGLINVNPLPVLLIDEPAEATQ